MAIRFNFNEDKYCKELMEYIISTYEGYYNAGGAQPIDIIMAKKHGLGFCMANTLKYAGRYGEKDGHNRKDLIKLLHYGILALYAHDKQIEGLHQDTDTE